MKYPTRIYYTETDKALMWDRWQKGESLNSIGRYFGRSHTSVQRILSATGGIRPPERRRSHRSLTLSEREEISRGIVAGESLRSIAVMLGRAPSTVSREINPTGADDSIAPGRRSSRPGIERTDQRPVNSSGALHWRASWPRNSSFSGHRGRSRGA
jgi:hypothetical protein